jgi:ribosome-binding protein aMBF1 (putative translation factor)
LGFYQRRIQVSRSHIPSSRKRRKSLPTTLKTLRDHIKLKRFENGLRLRELTEKLGVMASLVQLRENDNCPPDERQYKTLESLLKLRAGVEVRKPNR